VIYRLPPEASAETSAVSEGIRLIQKLAVKVVLANDEVAPEQTEYLAENLGSFLELSESDRMRQRRIVAGSFLICRRCTVFGNVLRIFQTSKTTDCEVSNCSCVFGWEY